MYGIEKPEGFVAISGGVGVRKTLPYIQAWEPHQISYNGRDGDLKKPDPTEGSSLMRHDLSDDDNTSDLTSWRAVLDAAEDLISIHDRSFRIVKANKPFLRLFGVDRDIVVGRRSCGTYFATEMQNLLK